MDEAGVVYKVIPEKKAKSKPRVLHRNMLMPCNYLPLDDHVATRRKTDCLQNAQPEDTHKEESNGFLNPYQYEQLSHTTPQSDPDYIDTEIEYCPDVWMPKI